MIISKKRFEEEVNKRVDEAVRKVEENHWRFEREERMGRHIDQLQGRLIECEKKCGIDHPSHHKGDTMTAVW
jgi:hypothetical protein